MWEEPTGRPADTWTGEREQERDRDKGTEAKPGSEGAQRGRPEKLQSTRVREEPGH